MKPKVRQAGKPTRRAREKSPRRRPALSVAAALLFAGLLGSGGWALLVHPETPLPPAWNPVEPLRVADPVTPLTGWKLARTAEDGTACLAALAGVSALTALPNFEADAQCHIRDRVDLARVGAASIEPVETRCTIALRLAMWERHVLQPAAEEHLGTGIARIEQIGSYNCRRMRLSGGQTGGMSTHATADALDVTGFVLDDGRRLRLIEDWDGPAAAFFRAARDGACDWFRTVLSPDYNTLHADHFHLQSRGWGTCR